MLIIGSYRKDVISVGDFQYCDYCSSICQVAFERVLAMVLETRTCRVANNKINSLPAKIVINGFRRTIAYIATFQPTHIHFNNYPTQFV